MKPLTHHLIATSLLFASFAGAAESGSKYLGNDEDDFSSVCKDDNSVSWYAPKNEEAGYLFFRHYVCDRKRWVWLIYQSGSANPNSKKSRIVDALDLTSVRKDESIMQECFAKNANGYSSDDSVFVVGKKVYSARGFTAKQIRAAWRVNQSTRKFEQIPVKGIECSYDD